MERLILIFVVSFGSLGLGFVLQSVLVALRDTLDSRVQRLSKVLKIVALLVLQPLAIIVSFWQLRFDAGELAILPALGALMVLVGGIAAVMLSRLQRIPPSQAASVFVSSAMSNVGLFGGLIAFVLFGSVGYSLLQLYRFFEEFLYYSVIFPFSDQIARGNIARLRLEPRKFLERPIALVPLSGIFIGLLLNFSSLSPPGWTSEMMDYLVPTLTGILGFAIGLSLKIRTVGAHAREVLTVAGVKFAIIPVVLISVAFVAGLGNVADGIPLKVVIIASLMPTGFIASVPPVVYGFDLNSTNSAWLSTTAAELVIIPLLVLLL